MKSFPQLCYNLISIFFSGEGGKFNSHDGKPERKYSIGGHSHHHHLHTHDDMIDQKPNIVFSTSTNSVTGAGTSENVLTHLSL